MTDAWDGMRWTNLGGDLDEMEVIGNTLFQVGVHVDSDPEFKAYCRISSDRTHPISCDGYHLIS